MVKRQKNRKKLTSAFAVMIAFLAVSVAVAFIALFLVSNRMQYFYTTPFKNEVAQMEIRKDMQAAAKSVLWATSTDDEAETKAQVENAQKYAENITANIEVLNENFADKELLSQLTDAVSVLKDARTRVLEPAAANKNKEALDIFYEEYAPALENVQDVLITIGEKSDNNAVSSYNKVMMTRNISLILLAVVAAISIFFSINLARILTSLFMKPIKELEIASDKLKNGDLDIEINDTTEDELGTLADDFSDTAAALKAIVADLSRGMQEMAKGNFDIAPEVAYVGAFKEIEENLATFLVTISNTLDHINTSSDSVSGNAQQIAQGAQALTEGATDQSSSIEELQATVTEVSEQVDKNAKNAGNANDMAVSVESEIKGSNDQMHQMVTAMDTITEASTQIENIIHLIDDIASQTNLLALNASIEAARAGEAGKGFAVVATEVGNLATQSAEAARNSNQLIADTIRAVENGKNIASQTASMLEESTGKTQELVSHIAEISDASEKQAEALNQIAQAVDQIASVVEENTAMAEESSASSEELAGQAQVLKELIAQFQLLRSEH